MAFKVKGLKALNKRLERLFKKDFVDQTLLEDVAKFSRDRIVAFTRSGRSLSTEDRLKALSEGYKSWRRKLAKGKVRGKKIKPDRRWFKPNRSNLTLTGQLLRSIRYKIFSKKRNIDVFATGKRREGGTNKEVAKDVAENGRPFIGMDKKGEQQITEMVRRQIRREIEKAGMK